MIQTKKKQRNTNTSTINSSPSTKIKSALLTVLLALVALTPVHADYLGTENVSMSVGDNSDLLDGFDVGDQVQIIIQVTPQDTGSSQGHAAWSTLYIPDGVRVVDARYLTRNSDGTYSTIAAEQTDASYNNCGKRKCYDYDTIIPDSSPLLFGNGFVNELQQDTGIFYSTDARTVQDIRLQANGGFADVEPSGVDANQPYNEWDRDQVLAFGSETPDALTKNDKGQGNTPIVTLNGTDTTPIWHGTGSPVAGPDTFYTNDYAPTGSSNACADTVPGGTSALAQALVCVGPWSRIQALGDTIGGSRTIIDTTSEDQSDIQNTSVTTATGVVLDGTLANALPAATNAVRIVHGARRLGDLEYWSVTLEITGVADFLNALVPTTGDANGDGTTDSDDRTLCADSIPGDTTPAKDNNWRYYEVSRNCLELQSDSILTKVVTEVNGSASSGNTVQDNDEITYEFSFYNTSGVTINNIVVTDTPFSNLTLLPEGSTNCPAIGGYAGIEKDALGDPTGTTYPIISVAGNLATWSTVGTPIASLAAGHFITFTVCGTVTTSTQGALIQNDARIDYTGCSSTSSPCLTARATSAIANHIAGTVYQDADVSGNFTTGENGIAGVTIHLYLDVNGDGFLDAGDTIAATTTTDSNGNYEFSAIDDGDYLIVEVDPSDVTSTGDVDQNTADPTQCAVTGSNNGCNTLGSSTASPTTITVTTTTNLVDQDFFDSSIDRSDAPGSYGEASHVVNSNLYIGAAPPDTELVAQPSADADAEGDDTNGDDGVFFTSGGGATVNATVSVVNNTGSDAYICAWLDRWTAPGSGTTAVVDGAFNDTADRQESLVGSGTACLTVSASGDFNFSWTGIDGLSGTTFVRFRLCSIESECQTSPTGLSPSNGEVEDYPLPFDFTPTAVTIGEVNLNAVTVTDFLAGLNVEQMSQEQLLALLAAWDASAASTLANADSGVLIAALAEYLDPDVDGQVAVLQWDTLEERGTIGFYVQRQEEQNAWITINNDLLPGMITAPMGAEYMLADPSAKSGVTYQYQLIELESTGHKRYYGPYTLELQ